MTLRRIDSRGLYPLTAGFIIVLLAIALLYQQGPLQAQTEDKPFYNNNLASIIALPLHFNRGIEGIALIDQQQQTICIYQYLPQEPAHKRFSLVAARSYKYDVQLTQFNTDPPVEEVKSWLRRADRLGGSIRPDNQQTTDKQEFNLNQQRPPATPAPGNNTP